MIVEGGYRMKWLNRWFSFSWKKLMLVAALIPLMWFVNTMEFPRFNTFFRDALQYVNDTSKVEKSIVTININKTADIFPRPYLLEETWKPLINKVLTYQPKYIIISVSSKELVEPEKGIKFFNMIPNLYFHDDYNSDDGYGLHPILKNLKNFFQFTGTQDKQSSPNDLKKRRLLLRYENSSGSDLEESRKIGLTNKPINFFKYSFEYWNTTQIFFKHYPIGTFGSHDAKAVLENKISSDNFKDKIVIIGSNDEFGMLNTKSIFNLIGNTNQGKYRDVFFPSADNLANEISTFTTGEYIKIPRNFTDQIILIAIFIILIFTNITNKTKIIMFTSLIPIILLFVTIAYIFTSFYLDFSRSVVLIFFLQYFGIPIIMFSIFKDQESKKLQEISDARIDALLTVSEKVAHDIRSPLSAINLVMHKAKFDDPEYKEIFDGAVQRIDETATKILTRYRTKTGSENENIEQIDLSEIINSITKEKKILNAKVDFEFVINSETTVAMGSKLDLERIISNILDNSIFALQNILEPRIFISIDTHDEMIRVGITDNGTGIPAQVLKLLGTARITTKADTNQGNGIGILHAKRVIERLKGRFEITSAEHVGTTIKISLPKA